MFPLYPAHPEIDRFDELHHNGGACPQQYTGWFLNGDKFYFRLRHGNATLRVWDGDDDVMDMFYPRGRADRGTGDPWQGRIDDPAELSLMFGTLYDEVYR